MSKVKVELNPGEKTGDTPTQAIDGALITDAKGRTLKLREIDVLDESRLVRALGSDASLNGMYMNGYVMPAAMVAAIDGDECILPMTSLEIDAAIKRLGRDGTAAILSFVAGQAKKQLNERSALKN